MFLARYSKKEITHIYSMIKDVSDSLSFCLLSVHPSNMHTSVISKGTLYPKTVP